MSIQDFIKSQSFKKYFYNTGWLMTEKFLRLIVGLFVGVYVARYLKPEQFGALSFAISFVALFGALGKLGLDGIVVRNVVQNRENLDELLGTAFVLRFIGGIAMIGVVFGAIQFFGIEARIKILIMIIAVGHILQSFEIIDFYFQSQVMARLIAISGIVSLLVSSIIKLGLIWSEASLVWFACVIVIEQGVKGVALCVAYIAQRISLLQWRFRLNQAKMLLRDSWPLILSGIVIMVYMRIDQVMIKVMLDNEAAGNYAAAVKLSEAWYFVPMVITQSLFPAILDAKKQSEQAYYVRLQRLYDLLVWLSIGVALPITILSKWVIVSLYGVAYSQGGAVLSIHIWAGLFVAMGVANSKWLLVENLQIISLINTTIGAFINIILNLILIPLYGIVGAALATVISYSLAAYFFLLVHVKSRKSFFFLTKSLNLLNSLRVGLK